ncbi:sensor histidine kinase [Aromatoleum bremense]|uniref:HAMP domain-containing protein n=1 Tax=Aromatoleum bremense TaxID=76115 RepID=A0ABX1NW78_9RHOO|nr:sensor histidine kinase [Aromatoleum bremense]NMG16274.1 HAMP domain-containing protein [Aromatoleum bremense]QTQ33666.1 two component system nitrate/nitrite sensor histidine kinase [Aromatoleum bremense]
MHAKSTTLGTRVGLALIATLALIMLAGAGWWVRETRRAIHEEVQAASHVAQQWIDVLVSETLRDPTDGPVRLMAHLRAVGRLRANQLEVIAADGVRRYLSPEPTYKAGRFAPEWFADWLAPAVAPRYFDAGDQRIVLRPDASRAILDAWDDLSTGLGSALALLLLVALAARLALNRALAPLARIDAALARGADGRFDIRLPGYRVIELDRLAGSYNRLADTLDQARAQNLRLEQDQAFARAVQARLAEERRVIARELHDELGQAITAVRAISGAILQRCEDQPQIYGSAQAILAMTGQMQDGVRAILQRLRPASADGSGQLDRAVADYCRLWSGHHPHIRVDCVTSPPGAATDEALGLTVLRLLQESLTNVARHAGASHVEVRLEFKPDAVALEVCDNGRGLAAEAGAGRFGLAGMKERVAEWRGELRLDTPPGGGLRVSAHLPKNPPCEELPDGLRTA